jgi:hypothetical protein
MPICTRIVGNEDGEVYGSAYTGGQSRSHCPGKERWLELTNEARERSLLVRTASTKRYEH